MASSTKCEVYVGNQTRMCYLNDGHLLCEIVKDSETTATKYVMDFKNKKIVKSSRFTYKSKITIVAMSTVTEVLTGRTIPVVLASLYNTDSGCDVTFLVLFVDLTKDKFIPLKKFSMSRIAFQKLVDTNGDYCFTIIDGPAVLLSSKTEIKFYYNLQDSHLQIFCFKFKNQLRVCCESADKTKCVSLDKVFGKQIGSCYIFFYSLVTVTSCSLHGTKNGKHLMALQFKENKFMVLDIEMLIPTEYTECISCIHVSSLNIDIENLYLCKILAGTSDGYILQIENGRLLKCICLNNQCPITFISCHSCEFPFDHGNFLVAQNFTYTVMTSQLTVEKVFSDVQHVFLGDFLKIGTIQYLFVNENICENVSWVLTDLDSVYITSATDEVFPESEADSISTAVRALHDRLQREQVCLKNEEKSLQQMADFVTEMLLRQVSLCAGSQTCPVPKQVDLVPIVTGNFMEQLTVMTGTSQPDVQAGTMWQRTYHERWCIGIDVVNNCDRTMRVWAQCIESGENGAACLACHSTGVILGSCKNASIESKVLLENMSSTFRCTKKQRTEFSSSIDSSDIMKEGTIVCTMTMPEFRYKNTVKLYVMLNWEFIENNGDNSENKKDNNEDNRDNCETGDKLNNTDLQQVKEHNLERMDTRFIDGETNRKQKSKDRIFSSCCGQVKLLASEVVGGKLELNLNTCAAFNEMNNLKELKRDRLAWSSLQIVTHLIVKSFPGVLTRLESLLKDRCGFVYNKYYDCYVTEHRVLTLVQLKLGSILQGNNRTLDVFHRNNKDLFLLIHHLYSSLPDDVLITYKEPTPGVLLQKIVPVLQNEIDFLSQGFRKLLNDHETSKDGYADFGDENDIGQVGENFKRKRDKLFERLSDNISAEKVTAFKEQLRKLEQLTDLKMSIILLEV